MGRVLIVGSSGHARVIVDIIERCGLHEIVGLLDDNKPKDAAEIGYPIVGGVSDLPDLVRRLNPQGYFIAVGDNWNRGLVAARVESLAPGLSAITAIHPGAEIARTASVGQGTAVMAGAIINSGATVGRFCIINTRASVDHDCRVEEFSSIGPGATLAGNVRVGAYSAVCLQACAAEKTSIGSHTVVGAGSVVLHDLPDEVLAYGTPARVIRPRSRTDRYLG